MQRSPDSKVKSPCRIHSGLSRSLKSRTASLKPRRRSMLAPWFSLPRMKAMSPVLEPREIFSHFIGPGAIADGDRRRQLAAVELRHAHERHALARHLAEQLLRVGERRDQDEAVQQRLPRKLLDLVRGVADAALAGMQQQVVAALAAHVERAVLDVRDVVVDVVVAVHERDDERAARREPPRRDVRRIAHRLRGREHLVARHLPHVRLAVEHARDGLDGNAGVPRDVLDRVVRLPVLFHAPPEPGRES